MDGCGVKVIHPFIKFVTSGYIFLKEKIAFEFPSGLFPPLPPPFLICHSVAKSGFAGFWKIQGILKMKI